MKVAVLFDGLSALGKTPDVLILDTIEAVEAALAAAGNEVVRVPVNPDGRWVERVRRAKFDLVFNLCESIDGVGALEPAVISALFVENFRRWHAGRPLLNVVDKERGYVPTT